MSKRNIEKHILMNKAEAQDLQKKAKRACLSEGGLIRLLLRGYEPREKPMKDFTMLCVSFRYRQQHQSACGESKHPRICGRTAAQKGSRALAQVSG